MKKVEVGEGWRQLEVGEAVQIGDQEYEDGRWLLWGCWRSNTVAGSVLGDEDIPVRRKVEPATSASNCLFEAGKTYPMRGGGKFRVYATDAGGLKPIHGAVLTSEGWAVGSRTASGHFYTDETPASGDLVLPKPIADDAWPDWVPEGAWYAREECGDGWLFDCKPSDDANGWDSDGEQLFLLKAFFPNFPHPPADMDWRETKCQKPKRGDA